MSASGGRASRRRRRGAGDDLASRARVTAFSGTTTSYSYDGEGKRLQASTGSAASAKTSFLWDVTTGLPQLVLERNGSNSLVRRYVNGPGRPLYWSTSASTANYLHWDPLGSVRNVTNASGATQLTYDYEPYGAISTSSGTARKPGHFSRERDRVTQPAHTRGRRRVRGHRSVTAVRGQG